MTIKLKLNILSDKNRKLKKDGRYKVFSLHLTSGYIELENKKHFTCKVFKNCLDTCVSKSGFHQKQNNTIKSRYNKTVLFFKNRDLFLKLLDKDLSLISDIYKNEKIAIRLNCFSDIDIMIYKDLIEKYKNIIFYDYSKNIKNYKIYKDKIFPNYYISFSSTEKILKKLNTENFIFDNYNFIFPVKSTGKIKKELPKYFLDNNDQLIKCIDGDASDLRFLDRENSHQGIITLLRFKGNNKEYEDQILNNPYIIKDEKLLKRFIY